MGAFFISAMPCANMRIDRIYIANFAFWMCIGIVLPNHNYPWLSFHQELVVAMGAIPLGFSCLLQKQQIQRQAGLLFLMCIFVILLQTLAGKIVYLGDMWLGFLYVSMFVMALHAGKLSLKKNLEFFLNCFSIALVLAGLLNFGSCAHQKFGLERLEVWVVNAPETSRAVGNLSQSNHTATFFTLGMLSAMWLFGSKKISIWTLVPLVFSFQLGLIWVASKTPLVMALWYFPIVFFYAKKKVISKRMQYAAVLIPLTIWLAGMGWPELRAHLLLSQDVHTLESRVSSEGSNGIRKIYINSMLEAIAKSPLTGYGFLQVGMAQWVTALDFPSTESFFNSAHMLPLDLALWFGVPVALMLFTALCKILAGALKRCDDDAMFYVITVICAICTHAMLEAPHFYMYFLLPVGMFLGIAGGGRDVDSMLSATKCEQWIGLFQKVLILVFVSSGLLVAIDYLNLEQKWERLRFVEANFMVAESSGNERNAILLTNMYALHDALSSKQVPVDSVKLNEIRNIAIRYPLAANLRRYAAALAYAAQYAEAERVIARMRRMHSTQVCELNKEWWRKKGKGEYPFLKNVNFSCNDLY